MEIARTSQTGWLDTLRMHAREHTFAATALGAAPALFLRGIPQRVEDSMLGLAAGAMIFVVSHEVIPETHRNGHQTPATIGLMAGFALMMALDTTLG